MTRVRLRPVEPRSDRLSADTAIAVAVMLWSMVAALLL